MTQQPVAIVGMGVILPGAGSLAAYWDNLVSGVDAITEIPDRRRDSEFHGHAGVGGPDSTHGHRGGFVADTVDFDPIAFGIPPTDIGGMEPDQITALAAAVAAVDDAGGFDRLGDRAKVGVILGRGGYLSPGLVRFDQRVRGVRQITRTVRELVPSAGTETLSRLRSALLEPLGEFSAQSAIGLVPNLAASRVANRLDLLGPAYTVDAACASSLLAIDHAVNELTLRRCDVVLAGGVHHCHDDTLWSLFTQIGALSPSQQIRPLATSADGLLVGEGTAVIVLKRLDDARKADDRVYAVIRGCGTSSDGRGGSLLSPSTAGQALALRRAWAAAGIDPAAAGAIGLLEAHGTATKAGDTAELATIADVFGPPNGRRGVVGSVKSMIGHTLPTAGVAGLVKVALALHHRVLPPTLHCADPHPTLAATRFRTIGVAEDWDDDTPRRAAVNAFGFGGVNAHVVLDQGDTARRRPTRVSEPERVLRIAARSADELRRLLDQPAESAPVGDGPFRIGIVGPTEEKLAVARKVAAKVAREGTAWHGAKDIWCTADPLLHAPGARTAFLFPGLEGDTAPRYGDVARHFGLRNPAWSNASVLDRADSATGVGLLLDAALRRIGVTADALAGHSVGEWTAMQAAGMYSPAPTTELLLRYWPGGFALPDCEYLVLGCAVTTAEDMAAGLDIAISHDNAPHQSIVCGHADDMARLAENCRDRHVLVRRLAFRSGFHTPFVVPRLAPFERLVGELDLRPATIPVWSATTVGPYPTDPGEVRALYLAHLRQRVRFRELVETMYTAGFRVFVQAGAGQLGSFVGDTLGDACHLVVGAVSDVRTGLDQLRRVATALWVEGARPKFEALEPRRVRLDTSSTLMSVPDDARQLLEPAREDLPAGVSADVVAEFTALLDETRRSAAGVVAALSVQTVHQDLRVSLPDLPFLRDHRFFRQRDGWPDESDYRPVVPATTLVELACRRVEAAWPGVRAVAVRGAEFTRWLVADPASTVEVSMTRRGNDVEVTIGPFARLVVEVGRDFPPAGQVPTSSRPERTPPLSAAEIYSERQMFHGPAYQGLSALLGIGAGHIRGELVVPAAPGALLDNVGQLLGCWMMATFDDRLLAFPRSIDRITWYEREPGPGTKVDCVAEISTPLPELIVMTASLARDGRLIARIDGWQDIRFACDRREHRAYAFPDRHYLSTVDEDGMTSVVDNWVSPAAREFYAGVYLSGIERARWEKCPPRERRGWLLRRIAIKDAVRVRIADMGVTGVYPAEILVADDEVSVSGLHGRVLPRLAVRTAQAGEVAVAQACWNDERPQESRLRSQLATAVRRNR
ncbi:MAG TPA: beta-ketoacyl synthase N-terminal-like domain-containing protein [Pseudonocardiaceae bacterium]|nr:beta-ketoacyl synthase N-terminal-like domain-containing protein [Pseudonocardiaceae bacterium]